MTLKYEETLKQFLELREWNDELIVDDENKKVILSTGVGIEGQSGRAIIEAQDDDIIRFYFYYMNFRVKESSVEQMNILLSMLNSRIFIGCLTLVGPPQERMVRWEHVVDFEGATLTGMTIQRNFQPGWHTLENCMNPVSAVALTSQTAIDALREHDAEVAKAEAAEAAETSSDDDVPDEL